MNLKKFRINHGLTTKDVIDEVQLYYPKYSKSTESMCEHEDDYGVRLVPSMERVLKALYPSKNDHKLQARISCRVTDEMKQQVLDIVEKSPYTTVNDWLVNLLTETIKKDSGATNAEAHE